MYFSTVHTGPPVRIPRDPTAVGRWLSPDDEWYVADTCRLIDELIISRRLSW